MTLAGLTDWLVQVKAWHRPGDKSLPDPLMIKTYAIFKPLNIPLHAQADNFLAQIGLQTALRSIKFKRLILVVPFTNTVEV